MRTSCSPTTSQQISSDYEPHTRHRRLLLPSLASSSVLLVLAVLHTQVSPASSVLGNNPPCHPGVLHIFNWCEQSHCKENCTCLEASRVCKQICQLPQCGFLFCSSPLTCHQSVIKEEPAPQPHIKKMIAHSPRSEQECNKGRCEMLKALRYDQLTTSMTFQSCADGNCGKLTSHADYAEQFCGNCKSMRCSGRHSKNCTQYCVLGNCPDMTCHARHCKQLCLHSSSCTLTCGPNTETCDQVCSHRSNCTMKCQGKHCNQKCTLANNCTHIDLRPTTAATAQPTTASTTLLPAVVASTPFFTRTMKKHYTSTNRLPVATEQFTIPTATTRESNNVVGNERPGNEGTGNEVEVLEPSELIDDREMRASSSRHTRTSLLLVLIPVLLSTILLWFRLI